MTILRKIYSGLLLLFWTVLANGQSDTLIQASLKSIPSVIDLYNTLDKDVSEISPLLSEHNFSIGDESAQEKANRKCCPDINYKEKKFFAKYYSNGQTDIQLIIRNDNKLFSIELIFPLKNTKYLQTSEVELKAQRFQITESKRNPKEKTIYKRFQNVAIPTRRAFINYYGPDRPDTITIDD